MSIMVPPFPVVKNIASDRVIYVLAGQLDYGLAVHIVFVANLLSFSTCYTEQPNLSFIIATESKYQLLPITTKSPSLAVCSYPA